MDLLDQTAQDVKRTISQGSALLSQAQQMLERGESMMREAGVPAGQLRATLLQKKPNLDGILSFAEKALLAEIDRDLPKHNAGGHQSGARARRQMV